MKRLGVAVPAVGAVCPVPAIGINEFAGDGYGGTGDEDGGTGDEDGGLAIVAMLA